MKMSRVLLMLVLGLVSLVNAVPNVMLFYEGLCPACRVEMGRGVSEALRKFGGNIFVSPVPFGNAKMTIGHNGILRVQCQHGAVECTVNAWHACSQLYMGLEERLNYTICSTNLFTDDDILTLLKKCTTPEKVAFIQPCAEGPMGVALIKLMSDITSLAGIVWDNKTRHLYGVPRIFIDAVPVSAEDQLKYTLSELICLKAVEKPVNC